MPEPRRRRADAQRNHDLVLAAAKEVFAEHCVTAPLDEIARRAGVGNATMYRHFPTRRELALTQGIALTATGDGQVERLLALVREGVNP